ncbi:MAG: phosphatase PAP2 family protein [Streptosporangiaceae bacterium]
MKDTSAAGVTAEAASDVLATPGWAGGLRQRPWPVPAALVLLLVIMTIEVRTGGPMVTLDERIRAAVLARANSPRWLWLQDRKLAVANLVVNLGRTQEAGLVLALAAVVAAIRQRSLRPVLTAALSVVLLAATVIPAKIAIGRAGPGQPPLPPGGWGSFPSGHSATATVCYILAAVLLAPVLPEWLRGSAVPVAVAVCVIVGVALVWCDDHWTSDVVAGWAVAALILMLARWPGRDRLTPQAAGRLRPGRAAPRGPAPSRTPDRPASSGR